MCPKLIELLSWNVHVCCFMLARASTKTFVSRIHINQPSPKNSEKNLLQPCHSLARGITVQYSTQLVVLLYTYFWPTLWLRNKNQQNAQFSTVRPGEPSGHVVIKTRHRTATPRLSTESIQFERDEVYIPSQNQKRILKTTKNPAYTNHRTEQGWNNHPHYITKRNYRK